MTTRHFDHILQDYSIALCGVTLKHATLPHWAMELYREGTCSLQLAFLGIVYLCYSKECEDDVESSGGAAIHYVFMHCQGKEEMNGAPASQNHKHQGNGYQLLVGPAQDGYQPSIQGLARGTSYRLRERERGGCHIHVPITYMCAHIPES